MEVLPKEDWFKTTYLLIDHGRAVCKAQHPQLRNLCFEINLSFIARLMIPQRCIVLFQRVWYALAILTHRERRKYDKTKTAQKKTLTKKKSTTMDMVPAASYDTEKTTILLTPKPKFNAKVLYLVIGLLALSALFLLTSLCSWLPSWMAGRCGAGNSTA